MEIWRILAGATGVEPIYPGSKPSTLPLCYTPLYKRWVAVRGVQRLPYTRERRSVPNGSPLPLVNIIIPQEKRYFFRSFSALNGL